MQYCLFVRCPVDVTVDSTNARNGDSSSNDLTSAVSDNDVIESVNYNRKRLKDEYLGIIIGSLATLAILLFVIAAILVWRRRRRLNGVHRRVLKCFDTVPSVGAGSLPQQTRLCGGPNVTAPTGKVSWQASKGVASVTQLNKTIDY